MKRSALVAVASALATAGFSGLGDAGPAAPPRAASLSRSPPAHTQDVLAHAVPAVSDATYDVTDTMLMSIGSPSGITRLTAAAATTLSVRFRSDPVGVQVNAKIVDFAGSTGGPTLRARPLDNDDARGSMIFLVGPTGGVHEVARPELSADAGQFSLFNQLPYDLFPGLPGRVAGPGDSWSDTVVWYSSAGGMETMSTTARTYTLVGDSVAGDRTFLVIALSADVAITSSGSPGGMATSTNITGSLTGHLLWDAEAKLLRMAEFMRRYSGQSTMRGRAPGSLTFVGPQRIIREK